MDKGDEEIFLPRNVIDALDYEYIFHTHPPTPRPGGRAKEGILYEFPSTSDIFHFLDHFNKGVTQGSLVVTSEGMYNIRKLLFDKRKINIDEDKLFHELHDVFKQMQRDAIDKYGTEFSNSEFYSEIAQDHSFINKVNEILNDYQIHIDFFSRIKDENGKWIIDTIHLPIYLIEPM